MGLVGDLTAGEIVEQLVHARAVTRIKNVVFMVCAVLPALHASARQNQSRHTPAAGACVQGHEGLGVRESRDGHPAQGMGEPLNNYEAVRTAVGLMVDSRLFALRRSKVTVSTVGIVPRIQQARPRCTLPFPPASCHAANPESRCWSHH